MFFQLSQVIKVCKMKVDIFKLFEAHPVFMISVFLIVLASWQLYSITLGKKVDSEDCWVAGIFYVNPSDFRLFLPKRNGLGYTLNFAHFISKVIFSAVVSVIVSAILFG